MDGHFRRLNREWEPVLGYNPAELEGKRFLDFVHPEDMEASSGAMAELSAGNKVMEILNRYRHSDGSYRWIEWRSFTAGNHIYASARDITERKKMTELIEASLAEKETLLKEIHHRVKNNMQVISSLLSMQSRTIQDESIRALLKESQNRIQSIALVHEQLYRSDSLYQIEYGGYIRKMFNPLFESYNADQQRISMHIEAQNVMITIEKAVPCSLIINELISNSLKHAFPQGRRGEIHIGFSLDAASGTYILDYRDNGVGIPPGKDLRKTGSLGMQLIYGLTQQLDGTITLEPAEGVHFIIRFPSKEKEKG
jgi:PAS domain S-box-containing protein